MNCLLLCLTLGIGYSVPTDEHLEPVGVFSAQVHYKNLFIEGNYYDESTWTMQGQNAGNVQQWNYFVGYEFGVGASGYVSIAAGYTDIDLDINQGNLHENVTAALRRDRACEQWQVWCGFQSGGVANFTSVSYSLDGGVALRLRAGHRIGRGFSIAGSLTVTHLEETLAGYHELADPGHYWVEVNNLYPVSAEIEIRYTWGMK